MSQLTMTLKIFLLTQAAIITTSAIQLSAQIPDHTPQAAHTNMPTEQILQDKFTADTTLQRRGFFRKIGDYFKDSNEDKTMNKKFDFSIIGGPHYSSDVKLGLGMVAAGLYRTDRTDSITPPSNVSLYGDIATSGFWLLGIRGNTLFDQARYRLDYKLSFFHLPSRFWGIGYDMARDDNNETKYDREQTTFQTEFMYRVAPSMYIGANFNLNYIKGKNFDNLAYLNGQKKEYTNTGIGISFLYDTRDYITDPHKGVYIKLENVFFPGFAGNKPHFNRSELTLDFYHRAWEGGILAYDLHGQYNKGNTPWTMLARLGGSHRMRGYYEGRYRDKGLIEAQVEIRQKVWRRIGVAAWGGAGNVFAGFGSFDISHTLPNYGLGFRWEFKSRVNVRLDYGIGKGQKGFIFNINEAF